MSEPQPESDLLDLVRQYGEANAEERVYGEISDPNATVRALFARIEAEVQRLRDEADASGFLAAVNKLTMEREFARRERDEALAEVERLTGLMQRLEEENERTVNALIKTREEREELDDRAANALAEVDRIKAAAPGRTEQARDGFGIPWFIHACGAAMPSLIHGVEHAGIRDGEHNRYPPCPTPGPWRPLLVATEPAASDPLVLRLPEVPDGAVALVGIESLRRYTQRKHGTWEPDEADSRLYGLGEVLDLEGIVRVKLAPPREPRTWPKLDAAPADIARVVEVEGHGRFIIAVRRTMPGNHTIYIHEDDVRRSGVTWTLGRLREVFDDEAGDR